MMMKFIDRLCDLEAQSASVKGLISLAGMLATGTVHVGIAVLALTALQGHSGDSGFK